MSQCTFFVFPAKPAEGRRSRFWNGQKSTNPRQSMNVRQSWPLLVAYTKKKFEKSCVIFEKIWFLRSFQSIKCDCDFIFLDFAKNEQKSPKNACVALMWLMEMNDAEKDEKTCFFLLKFQEIVVQNPIMVFIPEDQMILKLRISEFCQNWAKIAKKRSRCA